MSLRNTVLFGTIAWLITITALHMILNIGIPGMASHPRGTGGAPFRVGFLPVTCHLTCPVTHFINQSTTGDGIFDPVRFSGWPELKETFLANDLEATFILAPMAIALREQGVPIKIVYLGHRALSVCHNCQTDSGFLPYREAERPAEGHQDQTHRASVSLTGAAAS